MRDPFEGLLWQATYRILEEKGQGTIVYNKVKQRHLSKGNTLTTVRASASLSIFDEQRRLDGRIREQTEVMTLILNLVVEESLSQIQSQGDGSHDVDMQVVASL